MDVRTKNVTKKMKWKFEHKMVRTKHVFLSNHWQKMCTRPHLLGKYMFLTKRQPLVTE